MKYDIIKKCFNHFIAREITFSILAENEIAQGRGGHIVEHYKKVAKEAKEMANELKKLLEMN